MKSEIGSSSKKVKTVKVRTRPSDGMGAAPLPEGYAASIAVTSNIKVPQSYHETMRIAQEQRPYVPKKEIKQNKKVTIRAAGGEVWEDPSLIYWDEDDYRLFVGDLGNEVTDDLLAKSFSRYPSLQRTHVVRDKRSAKSKGFGFISFSDPDDYVKAMREMNGKYVGNRPITLKRSNWKERGANPENMARQKELAAIAKLPPKKYTGKNKN
ncbi:hypothetical protein BC833DRAFT_199819 [Globomyces pollinis-pini]|nr:hypothetical protein BC833DRAFT_199819 [Globomyces pollinis-pini]